MAKTAQLVSNTLARTGPSQVLFQPTMSAVKHASSSLRALQLQEADVCDTTGEVSQEAVPSGAAEQVVQAVGRDSGGNGLAAEQELQDQDAELIAVKVGVCFFLWVLMLSIVSCMLLQNNSWLNSLGKCAPKADCAQRKLTHMTNPYASVTHYMVHIGSYMCA